MHSVRYLGKYIKGTHRFKRRLWMSFLGVFLSGVSITCFSASAFGVDPFTSLVMGVWRLLSIGYNIVYIILNILLLLVMLVVARSLLGVATLFTVFVTGSVVQLGLFVMNIFIPSPTMPVRVVLLVIGVVLMCFAASLYFTADLGVSGYDAVALCLGNLRIVPFKYCRIATDLICIAVGFSCGVTIGVGTLVTAFCMGPLIDYFNRTCARPLLYGRASVVADNKYQTKEIQ